MSRGIRLERNEVILAYKGTTASAVVWLGAWRLGKLPYGKVWYEHSAGANYS